MELDEKAIETKLLKLIFTATAVTFLSSSLPTALNYFFGLPTGLDVFTGKRPLDFFHCFSFLLPYLYLWIFIQLKFYGKISFIYPAVNPICWLGIILSPISAMFLDGTLFIVNSLLQWSILAGTILFLLSKIIWSYLSDSRRSTG